MHARQRRLRVLVQLVGRRQGCFIALAEGRVRRAAGPRDPRPWHVVIVEGRRSGGSRHVKQAANTLGRLAGEDCELLSRGTEAHRCIRSPAANHNSSR